MTLLKEFTKNKSPDKLFNTKLLKEKFTKLFPEKSLKLNINKLNTKPNISPEPSTTLLKNKFPSKELNTYPSKELNTLLNKKLIILPNLDKSPELNTTKLNTELKDNNNLYNMFNNLYNMFHMFNNNPFKSYLNLYKDLKF